MEPGLVGLGGGLLDADVDLSTDCDEQPVGDPVLIGVVADDRSGSAPIGGEGSSRVEVAAAEHMVALVNCAGGVLGRPVEVVVAEVAGSPLVVRGAVVELVDREVSVVLGPARLDTSLRAAEAADGRVPVLFPLSAEPAVQDQAGGLFLLEPDASALAVAAAGHARDRGWRTGVIFAGDEPLDGLVASAFAEAFTGAGGSVTARLPLVVGEDGAVELGDGLDRLGGGPVSQPPPDVVFWAGDVFGAVELREALYAVGVGVPVVAIDPRGPVVDAGLLEAGLVESAVEGVELVGRWVVEPDGRVAKLGEELFASSGVVVDPVAAGRVADAVLVAIDAVDRAGSSAPGAVLEALREARLVEGLGGPAGVWPSSGEAGDPRPISVLSPEGSVPAGLRSAGTDGS